MPLIPLDPPSTLPRGHEWTADSVPACGGVLSAQSAGEPHRPNHAEGSAAAAGASPGPASSSSTRTLGISERRAARTQPAVPPPTTRWSYSLTGHTSISHRKALNSRSSRTDWFVTSDRTPNHLVWQMAVWFGNTDGRRDGPVKDRRLDGRRHRIARRGRGLANRAPRAP